jgi:peptidoglycan/LPS O-acetylase OafA/YrhL
VLSIGIVGTLAPSVPHFFREMTQTPWNWKLLLSLATIDVPWTPSAAPLLPNHSVNGSMWTLPYKFRCYLAVTFFGVLGFVRNRTVWLTATGLLTICMYFQTAVDLLRGISMDYVHRFDLDLRSAWMVELALC